MTNWMKIAEQANGAKHEHLHNSKRLALLDCPVQARMEFESFRARKLGERYAKKRMCNTTGLEKP